mmetsp:Transcript_6901/g.17000  ORF Transcript_6901/g.17000 Transcript_6901/m.17000 type:complete len:354 (-) Transcript_6901:85-1146(-)
MMRSAHSPVPPDSSNGIDNLENLEEEFDDPFGTNMASDLDDLALNGDNDNNAGDSGGGEATATATTTTTAAAGAGEEEADPWAVLAAAAGEEAPAPMPAPSNPPAPAAAAPAAVPAMAPSLAHAEGENFSMPQLHQQQPPSLAAQIQSSTANLSSVLNAKIQEVDSKTGISTRTKEIDEQYHLTEKWTDLRTVTAEKTKEVSASVKEKVGPSVKEKWGSIQRKSTEMGIAQKWSSLSSVVGSKWSETKEKAGVSVEQWKEDQERKRAMANAGASYNGGEGGGGQKKEQLQRELEVAKEKVVEGWTGGVNWVSQRIQEAKLQQQQHHQQQQAKDNTAVTRLDSDGLPSSFRKDL